MRSRNLILKALGDAERTAIEPDLKLLELASGDVLYQPDQMVEWVYFPNTAVLSVVTVMADGRAVESDTVGYEGAVGLLPALGSSFSVGRTFTQIPGSAMRMSASSLRRHAEASPSLRRMLISHAQANLAQAHQSVACIALHPVIARLCRWLLMSHDRADSDVVKLTQQYLATMLGVQRTTVTEALGELTARRLIRTGRGSIHILSRAALEAEACECYDAVRSVASRLTHQAQPRG